MLWISTTLPVTEMFFCNLMGSPDTRKMQFPTDTAAQLIRLDSASAAHLISGAVR